MYAGALPIGIETAGRLSPYERYADSWDISIASMLASSSTPRTFMRERPGPWRELTPRVEAYDASHHA
jgi:hypothetical protein